MTPLILINPELLHCPNEGLEYPKDKGIWRLLAPERQGYFEKFMQEYESVRRQEGRGATQSEYYRSLPFHDLTGRWQNDWRIRARSFESLISGFLIPLEVRRGAPLNVVDLGAGNCWLSNRLASRGHQVIALDLQDNVFDGLGACLHYENPFTPVQAEYDHLPFTDGQFDLLIFNASFHYSTDFNKTIQESLVSLREGGWLVILDSPVYTNPESGKLMVKQRESEFTSRFGFPSNAIPSMNYLTNERIETLGAELRIRWRIIKPNFGLRWAFRPWLARLRGGREPASFPILCGQRLPQSG